jgi:hypothetical protein
MFLATFDTEPRGERNMKRIIAHSLVGLAVSIPVYSYAAEVVIETATLQPNETKEVVVETSEKIKIGWNHADTKASEQCKNNCIEMTNPETEMSFSSLFGGSMGVEPQDGKSVLILKNVETFPLTIVIFKKPDN